MRSFTDSASQSVRRYLRSARRRFQFTFASRGAGATALAALLLTLVVVFWVNQFAFSDASVAGGRLVLFGAVLTAAALWLIRPLLGFGGKQAARRVERQVPAFDGRLETFMDRSGEDPGPFVDLLAEDTLQVTQNAPVEQVVSLKRVLGYSALGLAALAGLVWLGQSGPGYWGYGTARLWTGWLNPDVAPLYRIQVEPGDTTVRQGADLLVSALTEGFDPDNAELVAQFESGLQWEAAPMQRRLDGPGFEFAFAGVREPFSYYITSGGVRSEQFEVEVVRMPNVRNIKLTYHFPDWARMKDIIEDPGGDIRALEGTEVEVEIETDRPLKDGALWVNDQEALPLEADGTTSRTRLKVGKDGEYFIAANYRGERIRLTNDYFITLVPNDKPAVRFVRPGRDWKATSIEEVATEFEASDDFGLRSFDLHYSVNGAEFEKIPLAKGANRKQSAAAHTFFLENLGSRPAEDDDGGPAGVSKLVPGDLIAYYATAADHRHTSKTDMYFIEVRPFSKEVRQSQGGGGMGGQNPQNQISRRQREIIAATWNLDQDLTAGERDKKEIREDALVLSEVELTLRDQTLTLAQRARARELAGTNKQFEDFVMNLEKAAEFMAPASEQLKEQKFTEALPPEQKALQHLLRAEAIFRDIQVSFGQGTGAGQASRDLSEMFELEMDLEKNQYETGPSAPQIEQQIDEALRKLEELAKRQEKLAEQRRRRETPEFAQRWQQEVLRREAEELKKRLEELERQRQAQQSQSGQQGSSGQPQQGAQSSQQQGSSQQQASGQSGGDSRLRKTIERLEQAAQDMRSSQSPGSSGQGSQQQAEAAARRAQERLREALEQLTGQQRAQAGETLSELAEQAEGLAGRQNQIEERLRQDLRRSMAETEDADEETSRRRLFSSMSLEEMAELSDAKVAMQQELEGIERSMQEMVRRLRDIQPATTNKLREALGDLQESEVATRLRISAEYIRRQLGPQAVPGEEFTTRALEKLSDQLREAEQLATNSGQQPREGLEQTLAQLESIRRQLERAGALGEERRQGSFGQQGGQEGAQGNRQEGQRGGGGEQEGREPGQGRQPGDQQGPGGEQQGNQGGMGQGSGEQAGRQGRGEQPGEGQGQGSGSRQAQSGSGQEGKTQGAQSGARPSDRPGDQRQWGASAHQSGSASNFGNRRQPQGLGNLDPETQGAIRRAMQQAAGEIPHLTERMRMQGIDPAELSEIRRFVAGLANSQFAGNPKLLAQEHRKILSLLEQLELEVRRQVEQGEGGDVRAVVAEPVPERYREAVAEYFRRLSESQ